ncbi:MAG: 30S ribosomal protein S12 methylthiotransferase RimO [Treponema sp.]|nr:30S ribosomal protein S12 methylthiotransferase RimO [Treponema sp.]
MIYYLDPYGCAKNQVDAEHMMALLNQAGWAAAEDPDQADLIIVNSCGFIESAKQESINAVLAWRKLYPAKKILMAGCLAQRYKDSLGEELQEADGFCGLGEEGGILAAAEALVGRKSQLPGRVLKSGERPLLSSPGLAYVKVSEGCSNNCSYCAIPLIRGPLRSRSTADIIEECRSLLGRGIKELCLIGQDTGSYGKDLEGQSLAGLLEALARLEGHFWVRLLYIHPDHFPLEILDLIAEDPRFLPYFDIPFQHGSQSILEAMNRRGRAENYLDLIRTIRNRFDDSVVRSTFLVGFPGETEEYFQELLEFLRAAQLDWVGFFEYSPEEGTSSYTMKGRVSKKIARSRRLLLEEEQLPITEARVRAFAGRDYDALVEEFIEGDDEGLYLGRLPCQAPEVDGSSLILSGKPLELGSLVLCRVLAPRGIDLELRPLE